MQPSQIKPQKINNTGIEKILAHTLEIYTVFWSKVLGKTHCGKTGAADEGFILLCSSENKSKIYGCPTKNLINKYLT